MKSLLQEHKCLGFTYNYIDNIIIYSSSLKEHALHIKAVLQALTSVNLTVNPDKCHFYVTKVPMVGFWLEIRGIKPNYEKLCNMTT